MSEFKFLMLFGVLLLCFACEDKKTEEPVEDFPLMTISGVSKFEGNENNEFIFKVRLSKTTAERISVSYSTVDGSAHAGTDYEFITDQLVFEAGMIEADATVLILADTIKEGDEVFSVELSSPQGAVITSGTAEGTIRNDDTFDPGGSSGYTTPLSYAGYDLVWNDEFEGSAISDNWTHELGNSGWGNNESQNYTANAANSYIEDGKLVIEARRESSNGSDYSSARMITENKKEFQYGRIDIRAKLPEGQGIWPALWMLGGNFRTVSWPFCGEIDIMEIVGHLPSQTHGTLHWDNNGEYASAGGNTSLAEGKFIDEFHVFTIIWDEERIRWYLDDQQFHVLDISPAHMTEFHQPYFFIFNVAVGGNWPGYPDATTQFPQRMIVDYVRVFQK